MTISEDEFYPPIGPPLFRAIGVTASERLIQRVAEDTFFRLWCYSGLFNDEGINKRKIGTELCDLLIVFGDHVLVFSDKSIKFNAEVPVNTAWGRWYRRAVHESALQVAGAISWIKRFPERIYLDAACKAKFPLELPSADRVRFHRILLASNSYLAVKRIFGGESSGSFMLLPTMPTAELADRPFCLGDVLPGKGVFHVLNEYSLSLLLNELSTLPDFISYLCAKEDLIGSGVVSIVAGEEEFLAHYIQLGGLMGDADVATRTVRLLDAHEPGTAIALTEGLWDELRDSESYALLERLRFQARPWNALLEDMASHIAEGTAIGPSRDVGDHERVLRVFSEEPIAARAVLSVAVLEKLDSVPMHYRSARLVPSPTRPTVLFILVVFPQDEHGQAYADYRREREAIGHCYALVAKLRFPTYTHFAVLLTEPRNPTGSSRDFAVFQIDALTDDERVQAERLRDEDRILSDVTNIKAHQIASQLAERRGEAYAPPPMTRSGPIRQGRNDICHCGSGLKFKRCHGHWSHQD